MGAKLPNRSIGTASGGPLVRKLRERACLPATFARRLRRHGRTRRRPRASAIRASHLGLRGLSRPREEALAAAGRVAIPAALLLNGNGCCEQATHRHDNVPAQSSADRRNRRIVGQDPGADGRDFRGRRFTLIRQVGPTAAATTGRNRSQGAPPHGTRSHRRDPSRSRACDPRRRNPIKPQQTQYFSLPALLRCCKPEVWR
jgi:hypothetical protein